jgi:peptidoglycan/LPS O-acetylase OafA/YrhL
MSVPVSIDRTSSGKEHFEVLDGLRGGAASVIFLFPLIIVWGAHSNAGTGVIRLCKFSGRLSYPLYITHIPFVYVLAGFAWAREPSMNLKLIWIFVLLPLVITVAWLALKYFDEPVRAWLTHRYGIKRATA